MTGQQARASAASGRRQVLLGALLVAASGLMFALAGMAIKMAGESLSSVDILFWRSVLSLALLAPWICWHWPRSLRPAHRGLMAMRGVTVVAGVLCYYYAVSVLPLAEAVLLNFSAPVFVPLLGFLLFRFALDRRVLAAVLIGFAGRRPDPQAGNGLLSAGGPDRRCLPACSAGSPWSPSGGCRPPRTRFALPSTSR